MAIINIKNKNGLKIYPCGTHTLRTNANDFVRFIVFFFYSVKFEVARKVLLI